MQSYDAGPTDTPILEETIGANFEQTAAHYPDVEALVDVGQRAALHVRRAERRGRRRGTGFDGLGVEKGDRVGIWAPNCADWVIVQYAMAKIGAILVNVNPAYRTHELAYVLNQSGRTRAGLGTAFKTSDYVTMVDEVRAETPALTDVFFLGTDDWDLAARRADEVTARTLADTAGGAGQHRPDQHPVHLGHNGFPQGCDAVASQHPQQRVLRHRADQPRTG